MIRNGAWWTFGAGCLSCFLAGTTYTFGAWSPAVKKVLSLSQKEIGTLALAKDLGTFISMDAGLLTGRCGPHASMGVGCFALALSCSAIWVVLTTSFEVPFVAMIFLFWLFGHSLGFVDNAGIATSIRNFPRQKGKAVGLMKALEGLTAAALGTVFYTLFPDQGSLAYYPLVLALSALLVGVLAVPIMAKTNALAEEADPVLARKFSSLTVALLCYIGFCAFVGFAKTYNLVTSAVALGFLLSIFLLAWPTAAEVEDRSVPAAAHAPALAAGRPNLSAWEMLRTIDFYLAFIAFVILQGTGMMFANNLGQIVKALERDKDDDAAVIVTVFSVFNGSGRVFYGYVSDLLRGRVDRPWFLAISGLLMTAGLALLPSMRSLLGPVAAVMGLALGGTFALQAVVVEEIFGPKDLPLKYSCCYVAASLGSLTFSDLVAGTLYDAEAERQSQTVCMGSACFSSTFYVCAACCALAGATTLALSLRARGAYRQVNAGPGGPLQPDGQVDLARHG